MANRLRKTLVRIVNQSLTPYKAGIIASRPPHPPGSQQGTPAALLHQISQAIPSVICSLIQSINHSVCVFLTGQVSALASSFAAILSPVTPCSQQWLCASSFAAILSPVTPCSQQWLCPIAWEAVRPKCRPVTCLPILDVVLLSLFSSSSSCLNLLFFLAIISFVVQLQWKSAHQAHTCQLLL